VEIKFHGEADGVGSMEEASAASVVGVGGTENGGSGVGQVSSGGASVAAVHSDTNSGACASTDV